MSECTTTTPTLVVCPSESDQPNGGAGFQPAPHPSPSASLPHKAVQVGNLHHQLQVSHLHAAFARSHRTLLTACYVVLCLTPILHAQTPAQPPARGGFPSRPGEPSKPTFKRIEAGISDTGPMRVGLRDVGVDLAVPSGFRDVFEIQYGRAGAPKRFARVSGAVTAVFPLSIYTPSNDGTVVEIPPGTIFFVGGIPRDMLAPSITTNASSDALSSLWVDRREDTSVHHAPANQPARPSTVVGLEAPSRPTASATDPAISSVSSRHRQPGPVELSPEPSLMTDDLHRQHVVQALLKRAATASSEPRPQAPPATTILPSAPTIPEVTKPESPTSNDPPQHD